MTILLGLLTALSFGAGDFLAGVISRKIPGVVVALYSQLVGAIVMTVAAIIVTGTPLILEVTWGTGAGITLGLAAVIYYQALSKGQFGLVATIAGVWSAIMPFVIGIALGERPSFLALTGVGFVIIAIALVSGGKHFTKHLKQLRFNKKPSWQLFKPSNPYAIALIEATLAGMGFGLFMVLLDGSQMPIWRAASAVAASMIPSAIMIGLIRPKYQTTPRVIILTIATGIIQAMGVLTFIVAVRQGLLSIVAVAGALSPAPTALLARFLLGEKLSNPQLFGLGIALAGIVLITIG